MTIPTPAYPPPFTITRASHVVWAVKDLGASRAFYVDALGFLVSDQRDDTNALNATRTIRLVRTSAFAVAKSHP